MKSAINCRQVSVPWFSAFFLSRFFLPCVHFALFPNYQGSHQFIEYSRSLINPSWAVAYMWQIARRGKKISSGTGENFPSDSNSHVEFRYISLPVVLLPCKFNLTYCTWALLISATPFARYDYEHRMSWHCPKHEILACLYITWSPISSGFSS